MSENLPVPDSSKKTIECSAPQMQELNDVKQFYKIQHTQYTKYKILYDAVQDCVTNSNLDSDLKTKVRDILFEHNCAQVVDLDNEGFSQESASVLGLSQLKQSELNYNESLKLKKALELALQEKYKSLCERMRKLGCDNGDVALSNLGDFSLSGEDQALLELKGKVEEQQKKYIQNLLTEQEVLEDIIKLRLKGLPKACEEKVKECEFKSHMSQLQAKIVQEKTRVSIFLENSNSLAAYEELMKDIKLQQTECERDIQYLQKLKEKYKQVSCKQYDDLLKSFIQYKSSLEKKKMMFESLQS